MPYAPPIHCNSTFLILAPWSCFCLSRSFLIHRRFLTTFVSADRLYCNLDIESLRYYLLTCASWKTIFHLFFCFVIQFLLAHSHEISLFISALARIFRSEPEISTILPTLLYDDINFISGLTTLLFVAKLIFHWIDFLDHAVNSMRSAFLIFH